MTKCTILEIYRGRLEYTVEPLYSGHHWGMNFFFKEVTLSQGLICTKIVHLGLGEVAL